MYLAMMDSDQDKSRFQQLYEHYRGLMFYTANRILRNEQDAEDAVQQAFFAIAKNMDKISQPVCNKTKVYVVTIVENKAIDLYRARQRRPAEPLEDSDAGLDFPLPDHGLANAIGRLPARQREFILLKYAEGYTNEELSNMLGLTLSGVRSLDARAKRQLRKLLQEEGIDV